MLRSALQSIGIAVGAGLGVGLTSSVALSTVLERWSVGNMDDPLVLAAVVGTLSVAVLAAT